MKLFRLNAASLTHPLTRMVLTYWHPASRGTVPAALELSPAALELSPSALELAPAALELSPAASELTPAALQPATRAVGARLNSRGQRPRIGNETHVRDPEGVGYRCDPYRVDWIAGC
jgi:hypothetical protein